jgi:toxin YoeB
MNIQFSSRGFEDYVYWQNFDKRILKKVNDLLRDISRNPYEGIGKPEPLKHVLSGFWSRRITDEHRLVYRVEGDVIKVAQVRYHYE